MSNIQLTGGGKTVYLTVVDTSSGFDDLTREFLLNTIEIEKLCPSLSDRI